MPQVVVFVLGVALVAWCAHPRTWSAFKAFADRMISLEAKIPTQLVARTLDEDEELRETWARVARAVLVVVGTCMVIGSIAFIAQHGLGSA